MSSPSSLLRAHPPPSRLSAHFVFQLIRLTLLLSFPPGTRRASPVATAPFYPCRRWYPVTVLPTLLASVGMRILSSPISERLDQWISTFTRLHLRSRKLRPGYLLAGLTPTLSMGFRRQRFHYPLPSTLHGSGFYHDGTFTR